MKSDCYCINLRQASNHLTKLYDDALSDLDLTVTQYSMIKKIAKHPLNQTQLAKLMNLDRTTIIRNLKPLEKKGLIDVQLSQNQKIITLTSFGLEQFNKAKNNWDQLQRKLEIDLGIENVQQLMLLLKSIERIDYEQ